MITGVFCIVAGLARLGFLTNFLARPILTGYLNGIALSIISRATREAVRVFAGTRGFFRVLGELRLEPGPHPRPDARHRRWPRSSCSGCSSVWRRRCRDRWLPWRSGIAASSAFRLGDRGVALLGTIPAGLPALIIPDIGASDLGPLVLGAVGLALISFNSAMVTARSFAVKNRYEIDSNQEFIALGVADIGAGLLQGFAISGADSRTAVNDSVGGKSQVTGLVAAGLLVLVLLFLTGAAGAAADHGAGGRARQRGTRPVRPAKPRQPAPGQPPGISPVGRHAAGRHHRRRAARSRWSPSAWRCCSCWPGPRTRTMPCWGESRAPAASTTSPPIPRPSPSRACVIYRFDASLVFFNADYFKSRVTGRRQRSARGVSGSSCSTPRPCRTWTRPAPPASRRSCQELADRGIVFGRRRGQGTGPV